MHAHLHPSLLRLLAGGMLATQLLASCSKPSSGQDLQKASAAEPVLSLPTPRQAPPTPSLRARVFVDTSGSMQGFFGPIKGRRDAGRTIAAVHEELDATFAALQLGTPKKCSVGGVVNCSDFPSSPSEVGNSRLYKEEASRLDRVLARTPPPERVDPNNPPDRDLLDDAQLSVVVTDGMQAASGGNAEVTACAQGADPSCIASLLQSRISEGFGLWFVAAALPFNGKHFPERSLTQSYLQQTKKHVDELRFDPRNLGVAFATKFTSGQSNFIFEGSKPLLFIVLSRDPNLGRKFVTTLKQKLMSAPLQPGKMKPDDSVKALELAPLDSGESATQVVAVPREEQLAQGLKPDHLAEFRLEGTFRDGALVSSKVWCGSNGRGLLYVDHAAVASSPLPDFLKEQVALNATGKVPAGAIAPAVSVAPNRLRTGVNCSVLSKGRTTLSLSLETRVALDEAAAQREWWGHETWSSQNTWEMPERLYGLEDLVLSILKVKTNRTEPRSEVRVHVQRE